MESTSTIFADHFEGAEHLFENAFSILFFTKVYSMIGVIIQCLNSNVLAVKKSLGCQLHGTCRYLST